MAVMSSVASKNEQMTAQAVEAPLAATKETSHCRYPQFLLPLLQEDIKTKTCAPFAPLPLAHFFTM